jgi:C4-type Zn-finger protein
MLGTSSSRISCPEKCGDKEECFVHQARWEPVGNNLTIMSNYTKCNHCGYEAMDLIVPKQFRVIQK